MRAPLLTKMWKIEETELDRVPPGWMGLSWGALNFYVLCFKWKNIAFLIVCWS